MRNIFYLFYIHSSISSDNFSDWRNILVILPYEFTAQLNHFQNVRLLSSIIIIHSFHSFIARHSRGYIYGEAMHLWRRVISAIIGIYAD